MLMKRLDEARFITFPPPSLGAEQGRPTTGIPFQEVKRKGPKGKGEELP